MKHLFQPPFSSSFLHLPAENFVHRKYVQFFNREQEKFSTLNPVKEEAARRKLSIKSLHRTAEKVILIPKENIWFRIKYCYENGEEGKRKIS